MKRLLIQLLARVGLVPAGRYVALQRVVGELRGGAHSWKAKARQAAKRISSLSEDAKRQARLIEELRRQSDDLLLLRERLTIAERELAAAREQLMAVEVKLDILEGAANVLDVRTRAAVAQQHDRTRAPA